MPFELGLAVAVQISGLQGHDWFVFEAERHRLNKSLSDLGGIDPHVHGRTPDGVLRGLTNALVRRRQRPTLAELRAIYNDLKVAARVIKRQLGTESLFEHGRFENLSLLPASAPSGASQRCHEDAANKLRGWICWEVRRVHRGRPAGEVVRAAALRRRAPRQAVAAGRPLRSRRVTVAARASCESYHSGPLPKWTAGLPGR